MPFARLDLFLRALRRAASPGLRVFALATLAACALACSAERLAPPEDTDPLPDLRAPRSDMTEPPATCRGRQCDVPKCPAGTTTEIVGRVFAGNGTDPVPGAAVFIPVYSLPEIRPGTGCDLCNDIPLSVAGATTEFDGSFRLRGTAAGTVPIVVRLGRFQRVVTMDVIPCVENNITPDPGTSNKGVRLPRKSKELDTQDEIPRIAVISGDYDQVECVLKRIGVDQIDMYNGRAAGSTSPPSIAQMGALLGDETKLLSYNILIVNCTDNQYQTLLALPAVKKNLEKFVRSGGRLYVTDWAYDVIEQIPEFSPYLCFEPQTPPGAPMCMVGSESPAVADTRTSYGGASRVLDRDMQNWLKQFPSVINANNDVNIDYSFIVVNNASSSMTTPTKVWVQGPAGKYGTRPLTVTFDYQSCGRVHFSTYNTEPDGTVNEALRWPSNCKANFTPQERLLEYLFFNIASCVQGPG